MFVISLSLITFLYVKSILSGISTAMSWVKGRLIVACALRFIPYLKDTCSTSSALPRHVLDSRKTKPAIYVLRELLSEPGDSDQGQETQSVEGSVCSTLNPGVGVMG